MVSPCRIELESPLRAGFSESSAPRYSTLKSLVTNSGSPTTTRGSRCSVDSKERSIGSARSASRSPTLRLLSCASSMKRWISFRGAITFKYKNGKGEDFSGPELAVNKQVNGKRQDHEMEKPLVDRLARAEE